MKKLVNVARAARAFCSFYAGDNRLLLRSLISPSFINISNDITSLAVQNSFRFVVVETIEGKPVVPASIVRAHNRFIVHFHSNRNSALFVLLNS